MARKKGIVVKKFLRELLLEKAKERGYEVIGIAADALELMTEICEKWTSWFSKEVVDVAFAAHSGKRRFKITEKDVRITLKQRGLEWILKTR